ncbi:hypothetical protein B0H13DRAFT_1868208 [Mycena leptocephala]|nr:hypothetical protein B0H13DRAFT_1868208 [Mycena leptocephala]
MTTREKERKKGRDVDNKSASPEHKYICTCASRPLRALLHKHPSKTAKKTPDGRKSQNTHPKSKKREERSRRRESAAVDSHSATSKRGRQRSRSARWEYQEAEGGKGLSRRGRDKFSLALRERGWEAAQKSGGGTDGRPISGLGVAVIFWSDLNSDSAEHAKQRQAGEYFRKSGRGAGVSKRRKSGMGRELGEKKGEEIAWYKDK